MPISGPSTETELLEAGIRALLLRSFDAGARTRRLNLPFWDARSAACHLLEGTAGGRPHRVLIGKVRNPGGDAILYVRRLAARRKSLSGGAAVLCLQGGIPGEAALLAAREGIQIVTAGEDGIRIHTGSAVLTRHVSAEGWAASFSASGRERELRADSASGGEATLLMGRPFPNWLRNASSKLLRGIGEDCVLRAEYRLGRPAAVSLGARSLDCAAFTVWLDCRVRYRAHIEYMDPARARYDARKGRIVPDGEGQPQPGEYPLGMDGDSPSPGGKPKPDFHVFHPVACAEGEGVPDVDAALESLAVAREAGGLPVRDFVPSEGTPG